MDLGQKLADVKEILRKADISPDIILQRGGWLIIIGENRIIISDDDYPNFDLYYRRGCGPISIPYGCEYGPMIVQVVCTS